MAAWTLASVVYDAPPDGWPLELERVVAEMRRLARPGGGIAILCPADPARRDYLRVLRTRHGFRCVPFECRWRFPSRAVARNVLRFFFNDRVWKAYRSRMPEDFVHPGRYLVAAGRDARMSESGSRAAAQRERPLLDARLKQNVGPLETARSRQGQDRCGGPPPELRPR